MKISLYLTDKIYNFQLPQVISGSFRFDKNEEEEAKLINVEARNNQWVLYSTSDVSVVNNNVVVSDAILQPNTFYVIRKDQANYLIYVSTTSSDNMITYSYDSNTKLVIGNNNNCNVIYKCNYFQDAIVSIYYENNQLILEKPNAIPVYANYIGITREKYYIENGELINIFGLKIMFLPNIILINNPNNMVSVSEIKAGIHTFTLNTNVNHQDIEIKDIDLYKPEEYFSKSPRIRRLIETKFLKLSPPPKQASDQDMPLILTIGPMMTMGVMSLVMIINTLDRLAKNQTTMDQAWPSLVTGGVMMVSMILWPVVTKFYNKHQRKVKNKEIVEKYSEYLDKKRHELDLEVVLQKEILIENLITIDECLKIIANKSISFWDKRIDQSDFLVARIGTGNELLDAKIEYPDEEFTIEEDELRALADKMVEDYKYIQDVPVGYSFKDNKITAIMGDKFKSFNFMNNIILQLLAFYSYEELKFVIFTNDKNKKNWDYIKYLNHNFTNNKSFRFFASNAESTKIVAEYLNYEISSRVSQMKYDNVPLYKPHYFIIIDDYDMVKKYDFVKILTEMDISIGFNIAILENKLSKLPSKCNNFISIGENMSGVLKNSFEKQEQIKFKDEIKYGINMMNVAKILSNIPIEFEEGIKQLPDAINFLEMEKVGKVEQLNILNRWRINDSTISLKAEIGVDESGELMYLDLHEKNHGPHGLIAGMTGSGKSEFIITYILSLAINYSPDDVAFILIDYKGGGLAFAFENKVTNISLPHLAGTITNLDKAEMDRTLVSIDSEIQRRQKIFNTTRDNLGESTIDIYKYQKFFKEGKVTEAVPHLFIICDEFAELKSQQPDFMDNLISVARIGRSLGIHLILATQKPSGVVNDQIWSNSKFRVCLKVQDESDSKEMLKRPDAALLKQTGRFYLQVGFDEYFALGQSGWCGAQYYPSDKIQKSVDKSINFLNDYGSSIKSIQAGKSVKVEACGEQLAAIMNNIIVVAKETNKKVKRLWLENIPAIILVENLIKKYSYVQEEYNVCAIIGEYDAPEQQQQGLLKLSFKESGNTIIYGNDGSEREKMLDSIIYSTCINHKVEEVNYYVFDYGSEALRKFARFPHFGGMVFTGEDEKYHNLFKLLKKTIEERKRKFVDYGGEYENYNKANSNNKLPLMVCIINNYDALLEMDSNIYDEIISITRDSERYGVIFIITCNGIASISRRITQNFQTIFTLHMLDPSDYYSAFSVRNRLIPRDTYGRGLCCTDGVIHEFQTASLVDEDTDLNEYLIRITKNLNEINKTRAKQIPTLPERVTFELIASDIKTLDNVPIGIEKQSLDNCCFNFLQNISTTIASNKLDNTKNFVTSLIKTLMSIQGTTIVFLDLVKSMSEVREIIKNNYCNENFETFIEKLREVCEKINLAGTINQKIIIVFYGIERIKNEVSDIKTFESFINEIKDKDNVKAIICDSAKNLKTLDYEPWFADMKNNADGIWIGSGFADQTSLRVSKITKEMSEEYKNDFGYVVNDSNAKLVKYIDFDEGDKNE